MIVAIDVHVFERLLSLNVVRVQQTLEQHHVVGEQQKDRSPEKYSNRQSNVRLTGQRNGGEPGQDEQIRKRTEQKHGGHIAMDDHLIDGVLTRKTGHTIDSAIVQEHIVHFGQETCRAIVKQRQSIESLVFNQSKIFNRLL